MMEQANEIQLQDNVDAKHQIGGQIFFSFQMVWMIHDVSLPYKALSHKTTNIISNGVIFEPVKIIPVISRISLLFVH